MEFANSLMNLCVADLSFANSLMNLYVADLSCMLVLCHKAAEKNEQNNKN
jgi:hypothetical protein